MEKILVAEDDSVIRTGIKYLLTNEGYEIKEACDGNEALKFIKNESFDLILSDVMMPGKDGYELFEEVKKDEFLSSIPFLFLTAKSTNEDFRRAMNLGIDDYITKPFKATELLLAIDTRLKKKREITERLEDLKTGITKYIPHELRTPLVSILGYTDLILNDFKDDTPEIITEMVERIGVAGNRLLRTIEKFLIFTQLKSEINFTISNPCLEDCNEFSIARIFEKVENKLQKIYSNNVSFEGKIRENSLNIPENYFEILVTELLDNAMKFSFPNRVIVINTQNIDGLYQIEIINNGREFTDEQIKNVAEFVQFDREIFQQNGNGLGLSIVKCILKICDGSLQISSINNLSKITVQIPIKID